MVSLVDKFIDDLWIDDESIYVFIKYVKKL